MATKKSINKETAAAYAKQKKYIYSWITEGEGATEYLISDRLTTLNFDVSTTSVGTEYPDLVLSDGSANAYLKTIAAGYVVVEKKTSGAQDVEKTYNIAAPKSLTISGVDAGIIYGGAVVTTSTNTNSIYYSSNTSRYENVDAIVDGDANLNISGVKATNVYGGGAGYGSILDGDVNIKLSGTNTISSVFGGGLRGAIVTGDVNIDIDRRDATGGRISTVYGGGDSAVVEGDVNITVHGINAIGIGTISGRGKGSKAQVKGTSTLTIADYSGKFTTTIKDFDKIVFASGSAVTLTQSQNATIQSAKYEFVIDKASVNQGDAMLTWDKSINVGNFYVTIDADFAKEVKNEFTTTIFSSSYLTEAMFNKAGVKVYDEDGNEITSGYSLAFVADTDAKGNVKTKGGSIVLSYAGSIYSIDGGLVYDDFYGTAASDEVSVKTGSIMAGNINLGAGDNIVDVQGNAEVTGSIVVDKNSTNTIYVNGAISSIRGGDRSTYNTVYLNSPHAIGYYNTVASEYGRQWAGDREGYETNALGQEAQFVPQVLAFSSESNDTVVLSSAALNGLAGIDFAKGDDTLVLNGDLNFKVTYLDGNDVIVANQNGLNIDANDLKLAGTNNVFVVGNGVRANIDGIGIGDFMAQYDGIYLSQNALAVVNGDAVLSSYSGKLDLSAKSSDYGDEIESLLIIAVRDGEQVPERIADWYKAGNGVNATIEADDKVITVNAGAKVNGTIINAKTVEFKGDAGGDSLYFDNAKGDTTKLVVAKGATVKVGSIENLDGDDEISEVAEFEKDAAQLDLGNDARVVETKYDRTIVKDITKATTFTGKVAFIGKLRAPITLDNATAFFGQTAELDHKGITFVGDNTVDVNNADLALNNKKLNLENGTVKFNVLDNAKLSIDGLVNGETLSEKITYTLGTNAGFSYGDTVKTAGWNKELTAAFFANYEKNIDIAANSVIEDKINLDDTTIGRNIVINDGVEVTAIEHNADKVITLTKGEDTLTVGKAVIDGAIDAAHLIPDADAITLNKTTVNTTYGHQTAVYLDGEDTLEATEALINGGIAGGKIVTLNNSTVKGELAADGAIDDGEGAFINDSQVAVVSGEATVTGVSTLETIKDGRVVLDGATATINSIEGNSQTLEITNGAKVTAAEIVANAKSSTIKVREAALTEGQNIVQNGTDELLAPALVETVLEGDAAAVNDITQQAAEGETLAAAAVFAGSEIIQDYDDEEPASKFATKNDDIKIEKLTRSTGATVQTAVDNDFIGAIAVEADGTYNSDENIHKPAVVEIGSIDANYGTVTQEGADNSVTAGIGLTAKGESDVTLKSASSVKLGAVKQTNLTNGGTNEIDIEAYLYEDEESVLTAADINVAVAAVSQLAYKADNEAGFRTAAMALNLDGTVNAEKTKDLNKKLQVSVEKIEQLAYGGDNQLALAGNVKVEGDVNVGGVLLKAGENPEYISWGDRTAKENDVDIAADTVEIKGNVTMVGLTNDLKLTNASFFDETAEKKDGFTVGQQIYLAGKTNKIDLAAGVKMDNITLADLTDYDKFGKEGYELDNTKEYSNELTIRGELTELKLGQVNSNDTINVYGGKIAGDVVTNNGNDKIVLGVDDNTQPVLGDATIGGKVVMGVEGAAEGSNVVEMTAFDIVDADGKIVEAHNVGIGQSVEMYAGMKGDTVASNQLTIEGKAFYDNATGEIYQGRATIDGGVKMDTVEFDENGDIVKSGYNLVNMGANTKIGGALSMSAYARNELDVAASQEIKVGDDVDFKGYAEIAGQVNMASNRNVIGVHVVDDAFVRAAATGAGAYMNGISMSNVYADGDDSYLTSNTAVNAINVGSETQGSELIVGTSVDDLKNVSQGSVEFIKKNAGKKTYTLDALQIHDLGHDLYTYTVDQEVDVKSITASNSINVTGRFSANDVDQYAKENYITLYGNGSLGKPDDSGDASVQDAVLQASLTASKIEQQAMDVNIVQAIGSGDVPHYDSIDDAKGNAVKTNTKYLEATTFTADQIIQKEVNEDSLAWNFVSLSGEDLNTWGSIVANVGLIAQSASGYNTDDNDYFTPATNFVIVDGMSSQVIDPTTLKAEEFYYAPSTIGEIKQLSNVTAETLNGANAYANKIDLYDTNVTGNVTQKVADNTAGNLLWVSASLFEVGYNQADKDGTLAYYDLVKGTKVGGYVQQDGSVNYAGFYNASVTGAITQNGSRGYDVNGAALDIYRSYNEVYAYGVSTAAAKLVTGEGEACTSPLAAGGTCAGKTHDAETIKVQGEFNTQTLSSITQDYQGFTDAADEGTLPANYIYLYNVNVGDMIQKGTGPLYNEIDLEAADTWIYTNEETGEGYWRDGVTMMAEYDGEVSGGQPVKKVAEYVEIKKVTAGAIDQTGTENDVYFEGVDASTIKQSSLQTDDDIGYNYVYIENQDERLAQFVDVMSLDENSKEKLTRTELKDAEGNVIDNKYLLTTTKAIEQYSDAQKNYGDNYANYAYNGIYADDATIVDGDITQKATGLANFANVYNYIYFSSDVVKQAAKDRAITYDAAVMSEVKGKVEQAGAENDISLYGSVSGSVTQTANMLETYGDNGELESQGVNRYWGTNTNYFSVSGAYNDKVLADDGETVIRDEEVITVSVGDVKQVVNNAGQAKFAAALYANNYLDANDANLGDVIQELTYGKNQIGIERDYSLTNEPYAATVAGKLTQTGSINDIDIDDAVVQDVKQTAIAQEGMDSVIYNDFYIYGDYEPAIIELKDETKAFDPETNPYVIKQQYKVNDTSAKSITQELQLRADKDGFYNADSSVDCYNYISIDDATVGDVKQFGNGITENTIYFGGAVSTTYVIGTDPADATTYGQPVVDKVENMNTLGIVDQDGYYNYAYIEDAKSVGAVTQDAVSVKTTWTYTDGDGKNTVVKDMVNLYNSAEYDDVDEAGQLTQTATNVAFQRTEKHGDDPESDPVDSATYANNYAYIDDTKIAGVKQTGANMSYVKIDREGGDHSQVGAIEQFAASASSGSAENDISNIVYLGDFGDYTYDDDGEKNGTTAASIKQEALGEYKVEQIEGVDTVTKDIRGFNGVYVEYADVTGLIDQDVSGYTAHNRVQIVGEVKSSTTPDPDDAKSYTNGEYLNTVGDIDQYLSADISKEDWDQFVNLNDKLEVANVVWLLGRDEDENIVAGNANIGNIKQVGADGKYSFNVVYGKSDLAGYETVADTRVATTLRSDIESINQSGFENYVSLMNVSIKGNVEMEAKGIFKETAEGQDWSFGVSNLELNAADVKDIKVTTQKGTVSKEGRTYVNAAADANIALQDVTVSNITTGYGNDTVMLLGTSATEKTVVSGTIDLGENTWKDYDIPGSESMLFAQGWDTLVVSNSDLTAATVKADHVAIYTGDDTLTVHSLDIGRLTWDPSSTYTGLEVNTFIGANAMTEGVATAKDTLALDQLVNEQTIAGVAIEAGEIRFNGFETVTLGEDFDGVLGGGYISGPMKVIDGAKSYASFDFDLTGFAAETKATIKLEKAMSTTTGSNTMDLGAIKSEDYASIQFNVNDVNYNWNGTNAWLSAATEGEFKNTQLSYNSSTGAITMTLAT